jgi:hypothetical protein
MPRTGLIPLPPEYTSMQKPKKEPEARQCTCGRSLTEAAVSTYQSHAALFTFHRCECGLEWTECSNGVDRSEPVTTDEVIEVHELMARFEGPLTELLSLKPAS